MIDRSAIKLDGLKGPEGLIAAALGLAILEGDHPDNILKFAHSWGAYGAIDERYVNKLDAEYQDMLRYHQQKKPKTVPSSISPVETIQTPREEGNFNVLPGLVIPEVPHQPRRRLRLHLTMKGQAPIVTQLELAI